MAGPSQHPTLPDDSPPLAELAAALRDLRQEVRELRQELRLWRQQQSPLPPVLDPPPSNATGASSREASALATTLARSGPRLNREVWRRLEAGVSSDSDTAVDLLIDRLHDLALEDGAGLGQSGFAVAPSADGGRSPQHRSDRGLAG